MPFWWASAPFRLVTHDTFILNGALAARDSLITLLLLRSGTRNSTLTLFFHRSFAPLLARCMFPTPRVLFLWSFARDGQNALHSAPRFFVWYLLDLGVLPPFALHRTPYAVMVFL